MGYRFVITIRLSQKNAMLIKENGKKQVPQVSLNFVIINTIFFSEWNFAGGPRHM